MKEHFRKIASKVSTWTGSALAFLLAIALVVVWALTGPVFNYSDTWQLLINTGTTVGTFLMVFLIQNTQNRDGKAMQLKLDELILSTKARNSFVDLEDMTDDELAKLDDEFRLLHEKQIASATLHKLHGKIHAEHKRRLTLREAGQALNRFNPLSNHNQK
ncbi:low affinity iron permease family protein [Candidatus Saccharibacteria bacterium]|nr:low affinity iron permease family protein [Candidatus Saccharibacteria bacterium]MBI3337727.1 low affinity iron permease family protein [Candidatus Saccharibacteria bacterium]